MKQRSAASLGYGAAAGVLGALLSLASATAADPDVWSEVKVTSEWTDRFDLFAAGALRLGDGASHIDRTSWQAGVNFRGTRQITLTPAYQYIAHDPADDVRTNEHRFSAVAAWRLPFERIEATLSTGLEYRLRHGQADGWRVRPRLKFKRAFGPESWEFAMYVSDELFYDTSAGAWTRNRLFAGIEKTIGPHCALDLYFCRQRDLRAREPDLNIIGLSVRLSFDRSARESRFDLQD